MDRPCAFDLRRRHHSTRSPPIHAPLLRRQEDRGCALTPLRSSRKSCSRPSPRRWARSPCSPPPAASSPWRSSMPHPRMPRRPTGGSLQATSRCRARCCGIGRRTAGFLVRGSESVPSGAWSWATARPCSVGDAARAEPSSPTRSASMVRKPPVGRSQPSPLLES